MVLVFIAGTLLDMFSESSFFSQEVPVLYAKDSPELTSPGHCFSRFSVFHMQECCLIQQALLPWMVFLWIRFFGDHLVIVIELLH